MSRGIRVVTLLGLAMTGPVVAQSEADAVRASQNERFAAMIDGDVAALEALLGEELVYTHTTGSVETKSDFLETLASGDLSYESIRPGEVEVQVYGEAAVATGESEMQVRFDGQTHTFRIRFLEAHVKRDGRWQMVAWQSTRLP